MRQIYSFQEKAFGVIWHTIFKEVLSLLLRETGNLKPWPRPDHPNDAEKKGAQKEFWGRQSGQIQSHQGGLETR